MAKKNYFDIHNEKIEDWKEFREKSKTTGLPELLTINDLADYLEVPAKVLGFLTQVIGSIIKSKTITKRDGVSKRRLYYPNIYSADEDMAAAAQSLKEIHKLLLYKIFQNLPINNEVVYGFIDGKDVISCASQHVGKTCVVAIDLADFFPNTTVQKVRKALKEYAPFSQAVVWALTKLTTFRGHTPQGFATSPMITNFVFKPIDDKIHAWAKEHGWVYTRYADDLIFSKDGDPLDMLREADELVEVVKGFAAELDYKVKERKTKIMIHPQPQYVLGAKVNKKLNISRSAYRYLRAAVHNFVVKHRVPKDVPLTEVGIESYFRSLKGQVAWAYRLNPTRLQPIKDLLDSVNLDKVINARYGHIIRRNEKKEKLEQVL